MHLAYPASLQALHSIIRLQNSRVFFSKSVKILNNTKKQIIQIQHKRIKKAGGNQLAIYKHGRGFELRTTENKSSKWPEWDLTRDCRIASPTHWPLNHAASLIVLLRHHLVQTSPKKGWTLLGKTEDNTMLMYRSGNFIQFITQFNVVSWIWDHPYHKMIYDKKFSEHMLMSKHRWDFVRH